MKRIYPRQLNDIFLLSYLLEQYLAVLAEPPFEVTLKALAYDVAIEAFILRRLVDLQHCPDDAADITAEDFHIVFSNIMFRYPTVKMWRSADGSLCFER